MRQGLQQGPARTPYAFETEFGWVLAGGTNDSLSLSSLVTVITHHTTVDNGDRILRCFWEVEEPPGSDSSLTIEERTVMEHFKRNHS